MDNYFRLIKQSFKNTFVKKQYKLWWQVPVWVRIKFGLKSVIILLPGIVLMVISKHYLTALIIYFVYATFVYVPIAEHGVEELKRKYAKGE